MNKLELIAMLKNECGISRKEAATIVDLFFESMSEALAKGDRVEIRGLCGICKIVKTAIFSINLHLSDFLVFGKNVNFSFGGTTPTYSSFID